MIQSFRILLLLVILSTTISVQRSHAQTCYTSQGCSDYSNFGINSTTAATLEYDNYVSSFHSTAVRDIDGSFKVWGEMAKSDGVTAALVPQSVNPGNYPGLTGTPLKIAIGSFYQDNVQFIMLTSDNKLWVWGEPGTVFSTSLVSTPAFQQFPLGLPSGVTAANVKMMFAIGGSFVLTTCSGDVYVIVQVGANAGNGNASSVNVWNQVQKSAAAGGGNLTGIVAARGSYSDFVALDNTGTLWTWGDKTWDGSTGVTQRLRAEQIAAPAGATGAIKMIGLTTTSHANANSVYVLYINGNLYALGNNDQNQLGNWTTTSSNTWVQPRYLSATGAVMNDIKWISPQEHDAVYGYINVLTNSEKIYNWGQETGYCLGRGTVANSASDTALNPGEPIQFEGGYTNNNIMAIESGGHTTMALRRCAGNFGYVGHRVHGSMGDNDAADTTDNTFHFATNAVQVCGSTTTVAELNASVEGPYYAGNTVTLMGSPAGGTYTLAAGSPATLSGTTVTFTGAGTVRANYTVTDSSCGGPVTVSKVFAVTTAVGKVTIPGNVWNDSNGNAIRNTGENGIDNGQWANLMGPGGTVIASVKVKSDGSYQFDVSTTDIATSGNYSVILTNSSKNAGDALSTADAPANNYSYTGVNRDAATNGTTGVDATNQTGKLVIGDISTSAAGSTLSPVNFGIKLSSVSISGTVFNDANGNTIINTGETFSSLPVPLYMYLVNSSNVVIDSAVVAANGSYTLQASPNQSYTLELSTTQYPLGTNVTTTPIVNTPPTGWVTTGENINNNTGTGDGSPNGELAVTVAEVNISNANFGIEQKPAADAKSFSIPASALSATAPGNFSNQAGYKSILTSSSALTGYSTGGSLSGTDPEDCAAASSCNTGTGTTFSIATVNANTKLYYDYGGSTGVKEITPSAGNPILIPNYDASKLLIMIHDTTVTSAGFTYSLVDKAGVSGTPVNYSIQFRTSLPVTLADFTASKVNMTVLLQWTTTSELNSKGFEVEHSNDGKNWLVFDFVERKTANSAVMQRYTTTDKSPYTWINYYRLKQVDLNGAFAYSNIISVTFAVTEIQLSANPVYDVLSVKGLPSGTSELYVVTTLGAILRMQKVEGSSALVNMKEFAQGTYFIVVKLENGELKRYKVLKN